MMFFNSRIYFTVVSDPVDDEGDDCDDVGIAYVDLIQVGIRHHFQLFYFVTFRRPVEFIFLMAYVFLT